MIDPSLLEILRCPATGQPFSLADAATVDRINQNIAARTVQNSVGKVIEEPIEGALVRQDGKVFYPVRHNIPLLLINEAISIDNR